MPTVKLPDTTFTWDSFIYVVAFVVAVCGVLVAIVKGWEAFRKISVRDRVKKLERRMDQVEARLSLGDKRFSLQSDDMGHMLNTQMALMLHFYSGNDHDRLKDQITALTTYMNERATKAAELMAAQEEIQRGDDHEN